jgi:uncharacterized protein (DUF58 family)
MTPNGVVVALGAGAGTAAWLLTQQPAGLAVAVLCALLLALGLPQQLRPRGVVRIEMTCPAHTVERGESVPVTMLATGGGVARVVVDGRPVADVALASGQVTGWTTPPLRRGRIGLAVDGVHDVDFLGLWRRRVRFGGARLELTVLPREIDLARPPETADPEDDGRLATAVGGYGVSFAGLREYQPGDDIRHIDWAASARAADDAVYVRQFAPTLTDDLLVVLDVYRGTIPGGQDPAFEAAVDLAYSFTRHGADLHLGDQGRFRAGDEAAEVLLGLTPADTAGTPPLVSRPAVTVVVTATPERAGELTQAYAPAVPVFCIDEDVEADLSTAREVWGRWAGG